MKKLFLLFALSILATGFSQGEQLYADGIATDQEGNEFEWINYGTQDWAIENADVETYRDGTTIPQVTDNNEWANLTTGAWCYYNNDPTKSKLYNAYAILGIHDNDPNTPNKEFAPEGWQIPTYEVTGEASVEHLLIFLIQNGYNYDGTYDNNKIGKSMASTIDWCISENEGAVGNNQETNNTSGFNAFPTGQRSHQGDFYAECVVAHFWSKSTYSDIGYWGYALNFQYNNYYGVAAISKTALPVRFMRVVSTASTNDKSIINFKIFPNPTTEYINIDCVSLESVTIYNILGKELIKETSNRINVSSLSNGVYFIKVSDGVNSSTKKFIKD